LLSGCRFTQRLYVVWIDIECAEKKDE